MKMQVILRADAGPTLSQEEQPILSLIVERDDISARAAGGCIENSSIAHMLMLLIAIRYAKGPVLTDEPLVLQIPKWGYCGYAIVFIRLRTSPSSGTLEMPPCFWVDRLAAQQANRTMPVSSSAVSSPGCFPVLSS